MSVYQDLLKPMNEALMAVNNIKETNRAAPVFSNLSAVADGIMVLFWVTVDNRPYKHVDESLGAAQFFGNRVLKEQKDKSVAPRIACTPMAAVLTSQQGSQTR
jgi:adenylyl cyclase-associated protein